MTEQTHREGVTPRSGDTHVIDGSADHAEAVNVDAIARAAGHLVDGRGAAVELPAGDLAADIEAAPGITGDGSGEALPPIEQQADAEMAAPRGRGR